MAVEPAPPKATTGAPDPWRLAYVLGREMFLTAASCQSAPGTVNARLYCRMTDPRPGDLVMSLTRFSAYRPDRIGRLLEVADEPPRDHYVVELVAEPGTLVIWRDRLFIALPETSAREWIGLPEYCELVNHPERLDGRPRRARRGARRGFLRLTLSWCIDCDQRQYGQRAAQRAARRHGLDQDDQPTAVAYRCPQGRGWHVASQSAISPEGRAWHIAPEHERIGRHGMVER